MTREAEKSVLVVDDEPDVREYLASILRDAGFRVRTAGDGVEALEEVRREPPDFISLDLVMPRRSGQRLLYELRRHRDWAGIPVLIVTAHARDEFGKADLDDLLQNRVLSGPGLLLEKPVRPADYVRCVRLALGIEEGGEGPEREDLREELRRRLPAADPSALRRALAALGKAGPGAPPTD